MEKYGCSFSNQQRLNSANSIYTPHPTDNCIYC